MTPKKMLTVLAASAVLASTGAGFAQAEGLDGRGPMPLFKFDQIDADKDGKITAEEFAAFRKAEFAATDTNADGLLSADELTAKHLAEMTARAKDMATKMVERTDENGDGQLSAEEMERGPRPASLFDRADTDDDGAISKAEAVTMMDAIRHRHGRPDRKG